MRKVFSSTGPFRGCADYGMCWALGVKRKCPASGHSTAQGLRSVECGRRAQLPGVGQGTGYAALLLPDRPAHGPASFATDSWGRLSSSPRRVALSSSNLAAPALPPLPGRLTSVRRISTCGAQGGRCCFGKCKNCLRYCTNPAKSRTSSARSTAGPAAGAASLPNAVTGGHATPLLLNHASTCVLGTCPCACNHAAKAAGVTRRMVTVLVLSGMRHHCRLKPRAAQFFDENGSPLFVWTTL